MNDVFEEFVHVSTRTWLVLLGFTNVLYFSMGVVTFVTKNNTTDYNQSLARRVASSSIIATNDQVLEAVPITLTCLYIGYSFVFIFASYIISIKMQNIFYKIVKRSTWVNTDYNQDISTRSLLSDNKTKALNQLSQEKLFWFARPDLIITFAQIMQFG